MPVPGFNLLSAEMISATMSRYHIYSRKFLPPELPHFLGKAARVPLLPAYSSIAFWLLPFFLLQLKSHLVWLLLILFLEAESHLASALKPASSQGAPNLLPLLPGPQILATPSIKLQYLLLNSQMEFSLCQREKC